MTRASITDAKNGLSALLERVRRGEGVIIEDRGVPVARLEPVFDTLDDDGRIARLERAGIVRRPSEDVPSSVAKTPPPRPARGHSISQAVLDERAAGR